MAGTFQRALFLAPTMVRCSCTVSDGKIRRPWGTCAMPARLIWYG